MYSTAKDTCLGSYHYFSFLLPSHIVCRTCCLVPTSISSSSTLARPRASAPTNTVRAELPNYASPLARPLAFTLAAPPPLSFSAARSTSFVGTAEYVPPELLNEHYSVKRFVSCVSCASCGARVTHKHRRHSSDLWALSCVLYQFLAGKSPFRGANDYKTFRKIKKLKIKFPTGTALQRFYAFPPILAPCTLTRHTPHDTHTHTHTHTHKVFLLWPKT
jgi:serine/threonine protein kinase